MDQTNGQCEDGETMQVKIKEEEIPIEINAGLSVSQTNVKFEKEEKIHVRIKEEEEVPSETSSGGREVTRHSEDGLSQDVEAEKVIKVEVEEVKEEKDSMEIGRDLQYTRSVTMDAASGHVFFKPLSREEKKMWSPDLGPLHCADLQSGPSLQSEGFLPDLLEILKQKLLEKNRFPWLEGSCFPNNPRKDPNNPNHMEDIDTHKIGNTEWCSCGNCIPLPTGRESICCMEIGRIRPHLKGIRCITQHPYFPYLCENKDFAQIHQKMMRGLHPEISKEENKNRALSKVAYQAFIAWIHGSMRSKRHKPIPVCVVHRVRMAFLGADYATSC